MEFNQVIAAIEQADGAQIDQILTVAIKRYQTCYPDREIIFLSLEKSVPEDRRKQAEEIIAFLKQYMDK